MVETTGFLPSELQKPILFDEHRIIEVTGGIQSGKSEIAADRLTTRYWLGNLYWLIGPDYDQCRQEFSYLLRNFQALGVVSNYNFPRTDQCSMGISPDIIIETKSAKYPEKIAGKSCDGIILCEPGQMPQEIFERSIERLAVKDGWLFMAGTLEISSDWFADKYKDYQNPGNIDGGISYSMPTWSNTLAFPGGRTDPKVVQMELSLGAERFQERCGGVPLKPHGVVFPEFKSILHVQDVRLDPKQDVFIGIDPGYFPSVYAVEFIQFIEDEIYIFDEIFEQHLGTEQIRDIVARKPYASLIKGGAIDIASRQAHGPAPDYEIWRKPSEDKIWPGLALDARQIKPINDGINRLRTFLRPHPVIGRPQVHISGRCRGLLSEFGACKPPPNIQGGGPWRMKTDARGNVLLPERPEEDHCHAIKALIYCIASRYGLGVRPRGVQVSQLE